MKAVRALTTQQKSSPVAAAQSVATQPVATRLAASLQSEQRISRCDTGSEPKIEVVVLDRFADLANYTAAWEELAASAIEPNIFYEPCMLMPALKFYGASEPLLFVLIFARDTALPQSRSLLCGFFPLERQNRYKGLAVASLKLWKHVHCYLCTPLLRAGYAKQTLAAFFDWLARDARGCSLIEFNHVSGDGPFQQLLDDEMARRANAAFVSECFTRALLSANEEAGAYLQAALSGSRRKQLRRKRKRLEEAGRLECLALEPGGDIARWIEDFLRLEAAGWKGREGSAMACSDADRYFFEAVALEAFRQGRLMMLALHLDGEPVAQLCNFTSGRGAFAFKIAFDENYARFSPGVQLEIENIYCLHARPDIQWMDSCAVSDGYLNDLWADRRLIKTTVAATGDLRGRLAIDLLPLLRRLSRFAQKRRSIKLRSFLTACMEVLK